MYPMVESILLASQGIYDTERELFGTELLFRNDQGNTAFDVGEHVATSEVLVNLCSSITQEVSHLQRPAFINVCADFFLSEAFLPIDPNYVYIELVERITITPAFVKAVKNWKKKGFRFALDDFEFSPDWTPLLEIADVVKIDVLGENPEHILKKKDSLKPYNVKCLAERIETEEEFEIYKNQGFDYFQGYFLSRPKIVKGINIRPEQSSALDIMRVTSGDIDIDKVTKTVSRDPKLSLQILKMVNSPLYSLERSIQSIKEAIVFLGIGHIRKWALVLSLLGASNNCLEAHRIVLSRARFCESYAKKYGGINVDRAFVLGLISGMDILFGISPKQFVNSINVGDDIKLAIQTGKGDLGKVVKLVRNIERLIACHPEKLAATEQCVLDLFHESFHWSEEVVKEFRSAS